MNESVRFGLARLLAERICAERGISINDIDVMEQLLHYEADIPQATARALLWGSEASLDLEEAGRVAQLLGFHQDLLLCVTKPTSREILRHVLRSVSLEDLDPTCEDCLDLREWIEDIDILDMPSIGQLCLDVLGHISVAEESSGQEDVLLDVFRALDDAAQARVLAYAFAERGQGVQERLPQTSEALSRLRSDYLTPLVRDVLDILADSNRALSAREISEKTAAIDARAIGQIPRSLSRAIKAMKSDGHTIDESPLLVQRRGRKSLYKLSQQAQRSWLSLLESERSVMGAGE